MCLTILGIIQGVVPCDSSFLPSVFVQSCWTILTTGSQVQRARSSVIIAEIQVKGFVVSQVQIDPKVALEFQSVQKSVFCENIAESLEVVSLVIGEKGQGNGVGAKLIPCLLYTSPSPRD